MTLEELWNMTEGNRNLLDPTGWTAEKLEWLATIYLYGEKRVRNACRICLETVCCFGQTCIKSGFAVHRVDSLHLPAPATSVYMCQSAACAAGAGPSLLWMSVCGLVRAGESFSWLPGLGAKAWHLSVWGWGQLLPA